MIRIFKGDEEFDLIGNESIPMTYQSNTPEKPDSFQSNYSVNFDLPDTPKNQRLIGYSNIRTFVSQLPYQLIGIRIINDGIETSPNAKLVIKKIKRKTLDRTVFEVQIFEGNINFFDVLGEKTLQDLDLSSYNHPYTPAEMEASQVYDYEDGYVYDIYHRGQIDDLYSNTFQNLFPSIFARVIWDRIFAEAGFSYSFTDGVPTSPQNFNKLLVPFVNKIRPIQLQEKKFAKNSSGKVTRSGSVFNVSLGLLESAAITFNNAEYPKFGSFNENFFAGVGNPSGGYRNNSAIRFFVKVKLSVHFSFSSFTGGATVKFNRFNDLDDSTTVLDFYNFTASENGGAIDYEYKYEGIVELKQIFNSTGDSLRCTISAATSGTFEVDRGSFEVEVIDNEALSGIWQVAPNLPKIKQKDFVKNLMHIYGLFPQIDNWTNTIKITPFNKVKIIANALDFTNKIDESQQAITSFTFTDFAQENTFNYAEDESIAGDYSGKLIVNDETIDFTKEVLKLVFAASEHLLDDFNSLQIINFEIEDDTITDVKLAEYKNVEAKPKLTIDVDASNVEFELFEDLNFIGTTRTLENPRRSAFVDMDLQNILNLNWQTYSSILDKCQKEEIYLLINETDIQNLDFSRCIWLGADFQGYYYLSKIVQYQKAKESVLCELYRLNQL